MFCYVIARLIRRRVTVIAIFETPWASSVPIFRRVATDYFERHGDDRDLALRFYATPQGVGEEPDREALVCSARYASADSAAKIEIVAGPLLEAALARWLRARRAETRLPRIELRPAAGWRRRWLPKLADTVCADGRLGSA